MLARSRAPGKPLERPFVERRGEASVGAAGQDTPVGAERVRARVVERGPRRAALRRVKRNGGSPGIDGMTVEALPGYLREQWPQSRAARLAGPYRPQPVKRVEIPQPGGGVRTRGLPTVRDRCLPQARLQGLQPEWDQTGADGSEGCRPGRSAHQARAPAQRSLGEGSSGVVDLDLEQGVDRVHHDQLRRLVTTAGRGATRRTAYRPLPAGRGTDGCGPGGDAARDPARGSLVAPAGESAAGRARQGVGATEAPVRTRRRRLPHRRPERPRRAAGVGQGDALPGASLETGGEGGQEGGGPSVAAAVSGLDVHRASAEPTPGEREGPEGVPAGGAPVDVPDPGGRAGTGCGGPAAVPPRVVRLRWRRRSAFPLQGTRCLDPASAALLAVEAVGSAAVSRAASPWGESGLGLEHGEVRPWPVAFKPEPGPGDRPSWPRLRRPGAAASLSGLPSLTASTEPPET